MVKVGDKIKIISMRGEPQYTDKEGIIEIIGIDFDNETYYRGTWGGCSVYPSVDKFEVIS